MGQYPENKPNNLAEVFFSDEKKFLNKSFEFHILDHMKIEEKGYLKLDIAIDNIKCNQFIIEEKNFNTNFIKDIEVKFNDIKLKMINKNNYLEIKNYNVINKKLEYDKNKLVPYKLALPEIVENINLIEENKIFSIILKAKEKDLIKSYEYKFINNYTQNVSVKLPDEYLDFFENDKIYLFNGFKYSRIKNILLPINISSIEVLDIDNIIISKNVQNTENLGIANFQGKIKDIYLKQFSVLIEEINLKTEIVVKLNINLIKKINLDSICTFINFKKKYNIFEYTNLSDIYSLEETFVEIYFYDLGEKYYNRININNDNYINIDKNIIKFKIDSTDKEQIFEQKFIYEKIIENKKRDSYEFYLEINKGKTNGFSSFSKKNGGFTYQIHYQSKEKNILPKNIKVKLNEKENIFMDKFDNYENNLRRRFTIINAIKQDFIDKEQLDYKGNKIMSNNLKLYFLMTTKEENNLLNLEDKNINNINNSDKEKKEDSLNEYDTSFYIFEYKKNNKNGKERFFITKELIVKINKVFNALNSEENEVKNLKDTNLKNELNSIFSDNILVKFCELGFNNYIFRNNKTDYEIIKKIIFIYVYYKYYFENHVSCKYYISEIKSCLSKLENTDYLEKIQMFLFLFNIIDNEMDKSLNFFIDIFEKSNNEFNIYYGPCIESFNLFFDIIDKQTEKCPFYQAILQFNGLIKTDLIRGIKMYSGSINSLKNIKLELIKGLNRYLYIDTSKKNDADGGFLPNCKIIVFYPYSFFKKEDYKNENIVKKLETAFLFLIFHEMCGHFKTSINNKEMSPRYYLNSNLQLIFCNFEKADSGSIFETILTNKFIDLKIIVKEENSEDLFDSKYYIQNNFNELREKISKISPKLLYAPKPFTGNIKQKSVSISKEDKKDLKELPESLIKKLKEVEENLDQYNYHSLYYLFRIPDNMTSAEFHELLKDNNVYKKFKKLASHKYIKY